MTKCVFCLTATKKQIFILELKILHAGHYLTFSCKDSITGTNPNLYKKKRIKIISIWQFLLLLL